jgi:hypothetical protein
MEGREIADKRLIRADEILSEIDARMTAWVLEIQLQWDSTPEYTNKTAGDRMPPAETARHIANIFRSYSSGIHDVWARYHENMWELNAIKSMALGVRPSSPPPEKKKPSWWRRLFGCASST